MKLLSIIIPSYNMEVLLPKCLDSLCVKDEALFDALEVLVVNDGSKDKTSEIAHRYAGQYPGVFTVIDKPNGHYGSCINTALPQAKGMYVKILDADDYVDTVAFQGLLEELEKESSAQTPADVIVSDWAKVTPEGKVFARQGYDFLPHETFSMADFNRVREENNKFIGIHAICYRRALFDAFAYHQTEGCCYTDTEWFSIPMAYAKTVWYVPLCVTQYLLGRDGQSMDPKVLARDFHVLGEIAIKMIRDYQSLTTAASQDGREYLRCRILDLLRLIYHGGIMGWQGYQPNIDLKALDVELKALDESLYCTLDEVKVSTRRFNYFYIKDWRRRYSKATVKLFLFKCYVRM